jgi:LPS export ABC transporter permease LptG/LPS export ABC transporter permease LptF
MLRLLDRYLVREALTPTLLGLLVFTFILQIPPVMEVAERLIAKGVPWPTVGRIMLTLLPQALGITIPMALLVGLLLALGRLSGDREMVAAQACGVSVYRLVRPISFLAFLAWAATSWVLIDWMPRANQDYREIVYNIVASRAESEVKPRVFFEDFPNLVIYVRDVVPDGGGWREVFLADTRKPNQPEIFLAQRGQLVLDRPNRRVDLVLFKGTRHSVPQDKPDRYEVQRFEGMTLRLDPDSVFPRTGLQKGDNEMTIADLRQEIDKRRREGQSPHNQIMAIQKKFSIPVACFVFALLGLGLGVTTSKDGKHSSFVVAIAIIFVYYIFMYTAESMAKAKWIPAESAMWVPNIVLGLAGLALLHWRARVADLALSVPITLPGRRRREADAPSAAPAQARKRPGPVATGRPGPGKRVVVVVRFPQLRWPGPRILDWYVAKLYLRVFVLAFAGMLGIFYIATFIDLSDKLFKGQATGRMLLEYLYYATPQYTYYVLPIAVLVGTLVTVGLLTKSSELVVIKACGVSLYRMAVPLVVCGCLGSALLFGLEESILAQANRRAQQLNHTIRGGSPRTFDVMNRQWVIGRDGRLYHYALFDPRRRELNGLSVYEFAEAAWRIDRRTFASQALFRGSGWTAGSGWVRAFDRDSRVNEFTAFEQRTLDIEPAQYFMTEQPDADRMSYRQLKQYIGELRTSGFNITPYAVELQRKVSFPFVTVVMTLIAVPFAVTTGRRGALYGIGAGIVLALGYWLLFSLFAAIGTAGLLAPSLAAWAPNILFTAGAAYLLLTVRT